MENQQKLIAELTRLISQHELVIYCESCQTVFYAGTIKNFTETAKQGEPRDFIVMAMRHIWNKPYHHVTYHVPQNETVNASFLQHLPDLNILVNELKSRTPNAQRFFEELWNGKQPVKCSGCNNLYYGVQGWLLAARCCLEKKQFASELP